MHWKPSVYLFSTICQYWENIFIVLQIFIYLHRKYWSFIWNALSEPFRHYRIVMTSAIWLLQNRLNECPVYFIHWCMLVLVWLSVGTLSSPRHTQTQILNQIAWSVFTWTKATQPLSNCKIACVNHGWQFNLTMAWQWASGIWVPAQRHQHQQSNACRFSMNDFQMVWWLYRNLSIYASCASFDCENHKWFIRWHLEPKTSNNQTFSFRFCSADLWITCNAYAIAVHSPFTHLHINYPHTHTRTRTHPMNKYYQNWKIKIWKFSLIKIPALNTARGAQHWNELMNLQKDKLMFDDDFMNNTFDMNGENFAAYRISDQRIIPKLCACLSSN